MFKDRRIGKFMVALDLIADEPETVVAMMAGLIVVRAELRYEDNAIHYTAIGPQFVESLPGDLIPIYHVRADVTFDEESESRSVTYSFALA